MNRDNRFLQREYMKNLLPLMFSVLGGTINALIDSLFVSSRLGSDGLAAVSISMPVYLVLCCAGSLIASGAFLRSARAAGAERMDRAAEIFHSGHTLLGITGVAFTFLGAVLCGPISALLAQGGQLQPMVRAYCFVSFLGALPTVYIYLPMFYLQLEGKRRQISRMILIMVVTDALLDALFLYPLDMGMTGAALASVLSTALACVYGMRILQDRSGNYPVRKPTGKLVEVRGMISAGSPTAFGNLFDAVKLLAINAIILYAAGTQMAAVWAALNVLSEISLIIVSGVPQAASPMIAVYSSSKENSGIRILTRMQIVTGLGMSLIYAAALLLLTKPVERMFSLQTPMFFPLLCLGISVILNLLLGIWGGVFQATGRIRIANFIGGLRRLIMPVLALVLVLMADQTLWLFLPLGAILTVVLTVLAVSVISVRSDSTERPLSRILLLDDTLERQHKVIDFSIGADMESACNASEQIQSFCLENNMDRKATTRMGLSIEELLGVIVQQDEKLTSVDMRAYAIDGVTGIRIRYAGDKYNPFDRIHEDEDFYMGIAMLQNLAEAVTHTYTMGTNTVNILYR